MKQYNKTYLPECIIYNGEIYRPNPALSTSMILSGTSAKTIHKNMVAEKNGKRCVFVNVMPKSLKGKTDLNGKPYTPNIHVFTNY